MSAIGSNKRDAEQTAQAIVTMLNVLNIRVSAKKCVTLMSRALVCDVEECLAHRNLTSDLQLQGKPGTAGSNVTSLKEQRIHGRLQADSAARTIDIPEDTLADYIDLGALTGRGVLLLNNTIDPNDDAGTIDISEGKIIGTKSDVGRNRLCFDNC